MLLVGRIKPGSLQFGVTDFLALLGHVFTSGLPFFVREAELRSEFALWACLAELLD